MDVHRDSTVFCLFDPAAEPARQYRTLTRHTTVAGIESVLKPLAGQCRVAFEVGTQAQWIAGIVRPLAQHVEVANPSKMPWLFRDGRKNDKLDARKLVTLLYLNQLPTVHLPSQEVSAWRALINHRRARVQGRTRLKNQIRAILRTFGCRCPFKSLWTRLGYKWLKVQTFDTARNVMLRILLEELETTDKNLEQIEAQLDAISATQPAVALLRTIPNIGPRTAEAIVAFTDRPDRFRRSRQFANYFGMTPTLDSSGLVEHHGHISRHGPSVVRWVICQAAHCIVRGRSALRTWFDRVCRGQRNRFKKAIVALGRKVLAIAFRMMMNNKPYDDTRVCGMKTVCTA
jgi:transposase